MEIKDLQARQGNVDIELDIIEKEEPRTFEKFGKEGKVCNCIGKDATGQVKVTLWNEQADQVNQGDKIKVSNGWVGEYQGELQLSTGKFGKLEVIGASEQKEEPEEKKEDIIEEKPNIDEEEIEF